MIIEKTIPAPVGRRGAPMKYIWDKMEVGDSVFFAEEEKGSASKPSIASKGWGKKNGVKFVARTEGTGVRIWRTS